MDLLKASRSRWPHVLLALGALGLGAYACRGRSEPGAVSGPPSGTAGAPVAPAVAPHPEKLVGQWRRTDADYWIWIGSFSPDGGLAARYLNPRPIKVSRAEWKQEEGGRLRLLVELQDRQYPGSYYELTYDPASDGLSGVYHHLGLKQDFEVAFYRFNADDRKGQAAP